MWGAIRNADESDDEAEVLSRAKLSPPTRSDVPLQSQPTEYITDLGNILDGLAPSKNPKSPV